MKALYNSIKNDVKLNFTEIAHVCLWNDQLNNLEDEVPFLRPALFIEFGTIQWNTISKRQKKGNLPITLHLVTDCYDTLADDADALLALDLLNQTANYFDGIAFANCSAFVPETATPDSNHGNLIHQQLNYTTELTVAITDKKNYVETTPELKVTGGYQPRQKGSITPP